MRGWTAVFVSIAKGEYCCGPGLGQGVYSRIGLTVREWGGTLRRAGSRLHLAFRAVAVPSASAFLGWN